MSLVVVVPSQSGIVIAADSRTGISVGNGVHLFCDIAYKIRICETPTTVAVSVTGHGDWYPTIPAGKRSAPQQLAPHLSDTRPLFSLRDRLSAWLNEQPAGEIDEALINRARAFCIAEMRAHDFITAMPVGEISRVVLASTRAANVSVCFDWAVILGDDRILRCTEVRSCEYRPQDKCDFPIFGATDYVHAHVFGGPQASKFFSKLDADTAPFVTGIPVRNVTPALALKFADLLINATSEAMEARPHRFGVGGRLMHI
jgi:hypothetical protein